MHIENPTHVITMESGETWPEPSEDGLLLFIEDVVCGDEQFMILDDRRSEARYMQTILEDDGVLCVEHRDGGPDHHFHAHCGDPRLVHEVFFDWMIDGTRWQHLLPWEPIEV